MEGITTGYLKFKQDTLFKDCLGKRKEEGTDCKKPTNLDDDGRDFAQNGNN